METVVQAKALNKHRIKSAHVVLKVYPRLIQSGQVAVSRYEKRVRIKKSR